jgi:predicted GH43/DUF377 family glycosyl hydrolase
MSTDQTQPRLIQIGAGGHRPPGWINTEQWQVDIREVLPWPVASVDGLFLEKVLSCVTLEEAYRFLQDAWRVLAPGGVLRVAVPCPTKLLGTMTEGYLKFAKKELWSNGTLASTLEALLLAREHQSVWTGELLETVMQSLGFLTCKQPVRMSQVEQLQKAEDFQHVIGWENNLAETVVVEGHKPAGTLDILLDALVGAVLVVPLGEAHLTSSTLNHLAQMGITGKVVESGDHAAARAEIEERPSKVGLVLEAGARLLPGFQSLLEAALLEDPHRFRRIGLCSVFGQKSSLVSAYLQEVEEDTRMTNYLWNAHDPGGRTMTFRKPVVSVNRHLLGHFTRWGGTLDEEAGVLEVAAFTEIPTEHLEQKLAVPELAGRYGLIRAEHGDDIVAWMNPAAVVHAGRGWLAYRLESLPFFMWSRVALAELDEAGIPLAGTSRLLNLPTRYQIWGAEDPRFFKHKDELWLSYTDAVGMGLGRLDDNGAIVEAGLFPRENPGGLWEKREKNWGFFSLNGQAYAVLHVCPQIVRRVDLSAWDWAGEQEYKCEWEPELDCGPLHGGSNLVEHDGLLWRVVHSSMPDRPELSWKRYRLWMLVCDASPPFTVRKFSKRPLLVAKEEPLHNRTFVNHAVVFCAGLERIAGGWRLTIGQNDLRGLKGEVSDDILENNMVAVAKISVPFP